MKRAPKNNLKEFLQVRNETLTTADLYFYGDIVSDWLGAWTDSDQYPEAIRDFLKEQEGKNLNIYINSGGGSVFAGIAIYNMLKRHKGHKTVYVDGTAASIASVIALAGDKIIIPSNAFIMIHKPWTYGYGNANDFRKMADDLDAIETGIFNVYLKNLLDDADENEIKDMMAAETWLNGAEAAKYFNIEVGETKEYAAQITDAMKAYTNVPDAIIASANRKKDTVKATVEKINRLRLQAITKGV